MKTLELINSGVVLVIDKIAAISDVFKDEDFGTFYVEINCGGINYQEHFPDYESASDFRFDVWDLLEE